MNALKTMLQSRKFVALFTGVLASMISLILGHFLGETEKTVLLSQEIAGMILLGVSIYAGSTAYEDANKKDETVEEIKGKAEAVKEKVEAVRTLRQETIRLKRAQLSQGLNPAAANDDVDGE